jgi:hypothetical protein
VAPEGPFFSKCKRPEASMVLFVSSNKDEVELSSQGTWAFSGTLGTITQCANRAFSAGTLHAEAAA